MRTGNKVVHCTLLVVLLLITVNGQGPLPQRRGQYNLNVKQSQFLSLEPPKSPEDIRSLVETLASGTLYEYIVSELFDYETQEHEEEIMLDIDIPQNVSKQCQQDFSQMMSDLSQGQMYALKSVFGTILLDILGYNPYTICSIDPEYSAGAIVALCIFSILGLLIVGGTSIGVLRYLRSIIFSIDDDDDKDDTLKQSNNRTTASNCTEPSETIITDTEKGSIQNENSVDVPDNIQLVSITSAKPKESIFSRIANLIEQILTCFCAITNGKKILTIQKSGPYSHLAALNGIRVLSMFWVILGHTYAFIIGFVDNQAAAYSVYKRFSFQAIGNATFSVDSFFVLRNFHNSTDGIDYIYIKPWARINSYLVGMIAGYVLYQMYRKQWKMPKWGVLLGWCYAIATGIGMVYGLYRTTQGHYQTQPQAVFYQTVSRTLWSSAVAWVAFACAIGKGGPVNSILSWSAFAPLAKLTYCAYLLHPIIMEVYYWSSVIPFHSNDYNMVYLFLGNLVLSYAAAYIMSVCAEAPFMALEKLILPTRGSSSPPVKEKISKHTNC
ncbi:uncharacterized protein [Amphiura filiformis]|uniref:uncharacterized protein n=1 Tax=Amphiura filiformis TaxID=82378 RepID=UPI003B225263